MSRKFGLIHMIIILFVFGISCSLIGSGCSNLGSLHVRELPRLYQQTLSSVVTIKDAGSGVLISNEYVLTANHVASYFSEHIVQLYDGFEVSATIYARDVFNDLALLKISSKQLKFYKISKPKFELNPKIGEMVFLIGSPSSIRNTVTKGILSTRVIQVPKILNPIWDCDVILVDAIIGGGSSGSQVLNVDLKIIGIVVGHMGKFTVVIPSSSVLTFLRDNKVI